jgi:hypothetical protein
MTLLLDRVDTVPLHERKTKDASSVFYRRNEICPTYRLVRGNDHAEWLMSSTTFDSPWVTLLQGEPGGDHTYFQILGSPDRLIAEGGGQLGTHLWNWRADALHRNQWFTKVGPAWYEKFAYLSELLTAHDAVRMMWLALANDLGAFRSVAGTIVRPL